MFFKISSIFVYFLFSCLKLFFSVNVGDVWRGRVLVSVSVVVRVIL